MMMDQRRSLLGEVVLAEAKQDVNETLLAAFAVMMNKGNQTMNSVAGLCLMF